MNTAEQLPRRAIKLLEKLLDHDLPYEVQIGAAQIVDDMLAELRRLAAENAALRQEVGELRGVLQSVRRTLDDANQIPNGPIAATIWYTPRETLFDFIDAAMKEKP